MKIKKYTSLLIATLFVCLLALGGLTQAKANQYTRPPGLQNRGPLEKITFVHYKKSPAKPDGVGRDNDKNDSKKTNKCYDFLSSGTKWLQAEDFVVNPTNNSGLSEAFVSQAVQNGVNQWESYGADIFGQMNLDHLASAPFDRIDGLNVLTFGPYADSNVIGVTNVWGYFSGPPKTRQLIEWDMVLNTYFNWGDGREDSSLMDLENIIVHELGHSAGMADLYDTTCITETMYGYSTEGEISKRDLGEGDIIGIQKLY